MLNRFSKNGLKICSTALAFKTMHVPKTYLNQRRQFSSHSQNKEMMVNYQIDTTIGAVLGSGTGAFLSTFSMFMYNSLESLPIPLVVLGSMAGSYFGARRLGKKHCNEIYERLLKEMADGNNYWDTFTKAPHLDQKFEDLVYKWGLDQLNKEIVKFKKIREEFNMLSLFDNLDDYKHTYAHINDILNLINQFLSLTEPVAAKMTNLTNTRLHL